VWRVACGGWRVAGGGWRVAGGVFQIYVMDSRVASFGKNRELARFAIITL
jgi:hypothetical protein